MTANIKNAVILTGCVVSLSLVLFCIRFLPEKSNQENAKTDMQSINILNENIRNINGVDIINNYGEYSFIKKNKNSLQIEDLSGYPRNENLYDEFGDKVCNLVADKAFNIEDDKLDIYGFTQPLAQVIIKYNNNFEIKLLIGNMAPGNSGYYVTKKEKPIVYLVSEDIVSAFLKSKIDYISLKVGQENTDKDLEYLEFLNLDGYEKIKIINKNNKYNIVEPINKKISDSETDIINSLKDISAKRVETIKVTQEDIKTFGFDNNFMSLILKYKDTEKITILISKISENEDFFVLKKDSDIIYRVSKNNFKLDDIRKLISKN